jgi:anti-anti-sigma factor
MIETPEHEASPTPAPDADAPSEFACEVTVTGNEATIRVRGELDLATAPVLDRELLGVLGSAVTALTLDLHGVGFLDSSGIASLIAARRESRTRDVAFALVNVTRQCRMTIQLSGLSELFGLEDAP